jgi:hypothetical protein
MIPSQKISITDGNTLLLDRMIGCMFRYEVFAESWLQGDTAWDRPVDILVMGDGALLVSDDRAGVIYRIAYGGLTRPCKI